MIRAIYFLTIFFGCAPVTQNPIELINADQLTKLKNEGVVVVDIRTKEEYDKGHLLDAKHIDFFRSDFIESMSELGKDTPIIIHCAVGGRSGKAAKKLEEAGFSKIYDYNGGYKDWVSKGLEVDK